MFCSYRCKPVGAAFVAVGCGLRGERGQGDTADRGYPSFRVAAVLVIKSASLDPAYLVALVKGPGKGKTPLARGRAHGAKGQVGNGVEKRSSVYLDPRNATGAVTGIANLGKRGIVNTGKIPVAAS